MSAPTPRDPAPCVACGQPFRWDDLIVEGLDRKPIHYLCPTERQTSSVTSDDPR